MALSNTSVQSLKGVGEKRVLQLKKLGIETLFDLVSFYPRDYIDRTQLKSIQDTLKGEFVCVQAKLIRPPKEKRVRGNLRIIEGIFSDETGEIHAIWYNQPYITQKLRLGKTYWLFGKIDHAGIKSILSPSINLVEDDTSNFFRILPVYPSVSGLSQSTLLKLMAHFLKEYAEHIQGILPQAVCDEYELIDFHTAILNIHAPINFSLLEQSRKRLIFEELFSLYGKLLLQKNALQQKNKTRTYTGKSSHILTNISNAKNDPFNFEPFTQGPFLTFIQSLPFAPTLAQKKVIRDIFNDLDSSTPMNRLIQGDVGCGKTLVAAFALLKASLSHYQSIFLAPTSVLAQQHYEELTKLFQNFPIRIELLMGSLKKKEKKRLKDEIASGNIHIVVGTHAILEEDVAFFNLALVITDEQHRFGVRQRKSAAIKGADVDVLVMSATPIPRSLALVLYGDLDVSIIDEMPKGRIPVQTHIVQENKRAELFRFIEENIQQGGQAYIVCPLIEESEKLAPVQSAISLWEKERNGAFAKFRLGLLHGKLTEAEKSDVIHNFSTGYTQILISTTVVEVGVNVPNANIMVIENAERFGLSQLHQLRGRVGRGTRASYCFLMLQPSAKTSEKRLHLLKEYTDGFSLSQKDLELRGPGEFFGTRQHGVPPLKLANVFFDTRIMEEVQTACKKLLKDGHLHQIALDRNAREIWL